MDLLPVLLLGLGLLLIVAEVLFPSLGVLGTLAALCIVGACALAFRESDALGVRFLVATAILVPLVVLGGLKLLPYSPFARRLVAGGFSFEAGGGADPRSAELVGREGEVVAPLRPAGVVKIGDRRVDVVSRGEAIERGARVRVVQVEGYRVVVRRVDRPAGEAAGAASAEPREA
jgi:membrane-bound serine protease (ClpP class)